MFFLNCFPFSSVHDMFFYFTYQEQMMPISAARQKPERPQRSPRSKSGWSPERRARHAAAIRLWAPWAKSTGPRTARGKKQSAMNAYKHGLYGHPVRLLKAALTSHSRFLRGVDHYRRLKKSNASNELLNEFGTLVQKQGMEADAMLAQAFDLVKREDYRRCLVANDA